VTRRASNSPASPATERETAVRDHPRQRERERRLYETTHARGVCVACCRLSSSGMRAAGASCPPTHTHAEGRRSAALRSSLSFSLSLSVSLSLSREGPHLSSDRRMSRTTPTSVLTSTCRRSCRSVRTSSSGSRCTPTQQPLTKILVADGMTPAGAGQETRAKHRQTSGREQSACPQKLKFSLLASVMPM
jgi:hypothetical protein